MYNLQFLNIIILKTKTNILQAKVTLVDFGYCPHDISVIPVDFGYCPHDISVIPVYFGYCPHDISVIPSILAIVRMTFL